MTEAIPAARRAASQSAASPGRVFWATWAGWMLDGFDSGIYLFVLVPALAEMLPRGGIAASKGSIALYGGYLFTIFMLGWACSMFWGWLADRIGRVSVMCLTILVYSISTALCGLAGGVVFFAVFRFLAGFGIGGEWAAGTPLLQESVPEAMRVRLAGWLHTATPTGIMLASLAAFLVPLIGWRGLFLLGVLPALLTIYLRFSLPESAAWQKGRQARTRAAGGLFTGAQARITWVAALMMACIIFGLWSSTFWVPTLIISKLTAAGSTPAAALRVAALSGILTNLGTLAACLLMPWIAGRIGARRPTAALFFLGSLAVNLVAYIGAGMLLDNTTLFICLVPVLGFFTNGVFALYTIWLPELFPTASRAFGSGFAFSLGRVLGALGPSIVGALVVFTGSYPLAVAATSAIYLLGLPLIALAPETAGRPLPG
ncbi:MAG TPA: MFS transporter [Stellaceae bacterium]|jgi:MFS family permease|nr:MFS transporter [Stellaceae bacterium]